jgi:hypothetical protein
MTGIENVYIYVTAITPVLEESMNKLLSLTLTVNLGHFWT